MQGSTGLQAFCLAVKYRASVTCSFSFPCKSVGQIPPESDTELSRNNIRLHHSPVPARDMPDLPGCQLCSTIIIFFKMAYTQGSAEFDLGKLSDVISMPCPHSDTIRSLWEGGGSPNMHTAESWSVEIFHHRFNPSSIMSFISSQAGQQNINYYVELVANDELEHPGTALVLDSQWIDPSVPKKWYTQCLHDHGSECNEPDWMKLHPGPNAYPDWLIDVMDQCIVPFGSDTKSYVALSYTWGNVPCLKTTTESLKQLREPGSIHSREAPNISQTIRDAIGIIENLGERYLWVDSLCIIQDDIDSLSKNLNSMHRIYANSSLCLVAYAGTDANHGLRGLEGISAPRCVEQINLDIAGGEKLSCFKMPQDPRYSRRLADVPTEPADQEWTYRHRGWTYQEFVFAKRRLIFTDGPLRWLCANTKLAEERWDKYYSRDVWTNHFDITSTHWVNDRLPSLAILRGIVSGYSTRHFTYQSDVLKAFLGIQSHLDGIFSGGLNYGHPEMFFDIALTWTSFTWVTRRIASVGVSTEEDNPPSWSWMGWLGGIHLPRDAERDSFGRRDGFTESVAKWFSMKSPSSSLGDLRPINCKWQDYKMLFESDPSQVPDGWEVDTLGSRACRVGSDPNYSKYPVPIPSSTGTIQPIEQRKFLFARTSRCSFLTSIMSVDLPPRERVELWTINGEFAGFLDLHQESELDRFLALGTVELVAVTKGWTTDLDDFLQAFQEHDELVAVESPAPVPQQSSPYLRPEDKTKHKCYFVLCIQWENSVAERQASGKVLADVWERYQEPVDLILG